MVIATLIANPPQAAVGPHPLRPENPHGNMVCATIVSSALGILLLKEHLNPTKTLAMIGLLAGVFLLA